MKHRIILALILVVAILFRLPYLSSVPGSLHADEASFLINSASILETGRDEDNRLMPLFLTSLIDPKPALYSYLQVPFLALFGNTVFASRLPSVFLGVVSVYLMYLVAAGVTKKNSIGLFAAFVLAVSPWHIMNSRATQEVILNFVFVQGILLICISLIPQWLHHDNISWKKIPFKQYLSLIVLSLLAMYTYHASKVLLVIFFTGVAAFSLFPRPSKDRVVKSLLLLAGIFLAFVLTLSSAVTRFGAIGLLSSDLPKAYIFEFTTVSTGLTPLLILRVFYNKVFYYGLFFLDLYLQHFSLTYLFTRGGATARYSIPMHGLFYLVEAGLMLLGGYTMLVQKKLRGLFPYWLLFLLASPLAAALTIEEIPSSIRAFTLLLPLTLVIAMGFEWLATLEYRKIRVISVLFVSLAYLAGIAYFVQQLFVVTPLWRPWNRSQHYTFAAKRLAELQPGFEKIMITDDPREMYIYLWKEGEISLQQIQEQPLARYLQDSQFGKYSFNRRSCDLTGATANTLAVAMSTCTVNPGQGFVLTEKITFTDGTPAFNFYEPILVVEYWNKIHESTVTPFATK